MGSAARRRRREVGLGASGVRPRIGRLRDRSVGATSACADRCHACLGGAARVGRRRWEPSAPPRMQRTRSAAPSSRLGVGVDATPRAAIVAVRATSAGSRSEREHHRKHRSEHWRIATDFSTLFPSDAPHRRSRRRSTRRRVNRARRWRRRAAAMADMLPEPPPPRRALGPTDDVKLRRVGHHRARATSEDAVDGLADADEHQDDERLQARPLRIAACSARRPRVSGSALGTPHAALAHARIRQLAPMGIVQRLELRPMTPARRRLPAARTARPTNCALRCTPTAHCAASNCAAHPRSRPGPGAAPPRWRTNFSR